MKSLTMLWRVLAQELGDTCCVSTARDSLTVERRIEGEGLSFLGITLPNFGKDLERGLDLGYVADDMFLGFKRHAGLPAFLRGFLQLIFDPLSGRLVDCPDIDAIFAVRQLTLFFSKIEVPASQKRWDAAMRGFVDCEAEVKRSDSARTDSQESKFGQISGLLWNEVLSRVDKALYDDQEESSRVSNPEWPFIIPKHGPGATADRVRGNAKFEFSEWSERLESVFPFVEYALPSWRYYPHLDRVDFREPGTERPVRVISVPKTLKTPRIIAIEPSYMQFMQQGVKDRLVTEIRRDNLVSPMFGYDDQSVNRRLAMVGSLTGSLATLDLSEASDRVSNQLVRLLASNFPHFGEALDATRSRKADVPGKGVIRLSKFASMGSALTFPIEAMVFMTVVFIGIEKELNRPLTRRDIYLLRDKVRVYGDDIIVPTHYAQSVTEALELFGFKVNTAKSFWTGRFRESCGREFYMGEDVSITRVRSIVNTDTYVGLPTSRRHVREIESTVSLRNRLYLAGLWQTASWIDKWLEPILRLYPTVQVRLSDPWESPEVRSSILARWSLLPFTLSTRVNTRVDPNLHTPVVLGWELEEKIPTSVASDLGALMKTLPPREIPFEDEQHLERAGRPTSVSMKRRWRTPV
jgi:hypothetical protein